MTERINYDLLKKIQAIQDGDLQPTELLGHTTNSKTKANIPMAFQKSVCEDGCN